MTLRPLLLTLLTVPALAVTPKHLTGTVTGPDGQPLRNASVKLQNSKSHQVTSRLSAADGHFRFNRIPTDTEFTVWATWHGHRSDTKHVTRFDSGRDVDLDLQISTH